MALLGMGMLLAAFSLRPLALPDGHLHARAVHVSDACSPVCPHVSARVVLAHAVQAHSHSRYFSATPPRSRDPDMEWEKKTLMTGDGTKCRAPSSFERLNANVVWLVRVQAMLSSKFWTRFWSSTKSLYAVSLVPKMDPNSATSALKFFGFVLFGFGRFRGEAGPARRSAPALAWQRVATPPTVPHRWAAAR